VNGLFVLHPILEILMRHIEFKERESKSKQSKVPKFLILTNKIGGDK
jgi:hypothetical protein